MVLFGPSGCGDEFYNEGKKGVLEIPNWIKNYGLDAYEYSFGHGYQMSMELAQKAGELFKQEDIKLSLHAPFYINFANPDDEMYLKTQGYIYTGIRFLRAFGADKLVFHAASCGKLNREEALKLTTNRFESFFEKLESENLLDGLYLCPKQWEKLCKLEHTKKLLSYAK